MNKSILAMTLALLSGVSMADYAIRGAGIKQVRNTGLPAD